jgi:hypothetical protein
MKMNVLADFLFCFGDSRCIFVVFEAYELGIDKGVFDVPISEELHSVENVFGFVIIHRGFPVPECVK